MRYIWVLLDWAAILKDLISEKYGTGISDKSMKWLFSVLSRVVFLVLSSRCVQLNVNAYSTQPGPRERKLVCTHLFAHTCTVQLKMQICMRKSDPVSLTCLDLSDVLLHWEDSEFVAVYHRGRYFRLWVYHAGRLLSPREIQYQIQKILDDPSPPFPGEDKLGALTAGNRSDT